MTLPWHLCRVAGVLPSPLGLHTGDTGRCLMCAQLRARGARCMAAVASIPACLHQAGTRQAVLKACVQMHMSPAQRPAKRFVVLHPAAPSRWRGHVGAAEEVEVAQVARRLRASGYLVVVEDDPAAAAAQVRDVVPAGRARAHVADEAQQLVAAGPVRDGGRACAAPAQSSWGPTRRV